MATKSTRPRRPWKRGLGWICKLEKGRFLGCDALAAQKQAGVKRKLVGFEMIDKRIGRDGYTVQLAGREVGCVTRAAARRHF